MKLVKYPDGSSYVKLDSKDTYHNITVKINSYEDLWHLGQIVEVANHNRVKPIVTISNLIDAQADRRFGKNQSIGLSIVCSFLNLFEVSSYKVFHPHNPEVLEAILHKVEVIDNSRFVKGVLEDHLKVNPENTILMSSDSGGFKPLMKLCDKINWKGETFSASKSRSWDDETGTTFVQQVHRNDFEGKDIIIIDDLCIYGGTFKGLSRLLQTKNCGKLYLVVSHLTVQDLGLDPVTNYFEEVITTNSKYDNYTFKVLDKNHGILPTKYQPKNLTIKDVFSFTPLV